MRVAPAPWLQVAALLCDVDEMQAVLNVGDARGDTPLHAAACNAAYSCVELLLGFAADPAPVNAAGYCPSDLAAMVGAQDIVELLADYGGGGGAGAGAEYDDTAGAAGATEGEGPRSGRRGVLRATPGQEATALVLVWSPCG